MATASVWALGAEGRGRRIRRGIRGLPPELDPLASGGEEPAGKDMGAIAILRGRGGWVAKKPKPTEKVFGLAADEML